MKLFKNLIHNSKYSFLGLSMILLGWDLYNTPNYFFWPPRYADLMNDNGIDAIAIMIGLGLIIYAGAGMHNNTLISWLLGIAVAFATVIFCVEIMHSIFGGFIGHRFMGIPAILALYMVGSILQIARDRDTEK